MLTRCTLIGCLVPLLNTNGVIAALLNTTKVKQDHFIVQKEILKGNEEIFTVHEEMPKFRQLKSNKSQTQFMVQEGNFKNIAERRRRPQVETTSLDFRVTTPRSSEYTFPYKTSLRQNSNCIEKPQITSADKEKPQNTSPDLIYDAYITYLREYFNDFKDRQSQMNNNKEQTQIAPSPSSFSIFSTKAASENATYPNPYFSRSFIKLLIQERIRNSGIVLVPIIESGIVETSINGFIPYSSPICPDGFKWFENKCRKIYRLYSSKKT